MGRKGVSKRKSSKTKGLPVSNVSTKDTVSSIVRASEAPTPQAPGKGDAPGKGAGGKKKSSDAPRGNQRR
jgi:hypothetical protein